MSRAKNPSRGPSRDRYVTPMWCIRELAKVIRRHMPLTDWVVDLGAGDGRIGRTIRHVLSFPPYKPNLLLVEKYKCSSWPESDLINGSYPEMASEIMDHIGLLPTVLFVSNPPFSQSLEFVECALRQIELLGPGSAAIFLLPLNWFGSLKRNAFHKDHPPNRLIVLTPRPSFTGKGTDSNEYAWWWWCQGQTAGMSTKIDIVRGDKSEKASVC